MIRPEIERGMDLDVRDLLHAIKNAFWKLLFISFLLGCAVFIMLSFVAPKYASDAKIILKHKEDPNINSPLRRVGYAGRDLVNEAIVRGQVEVVKSRDLLHDVVRDLKLTDVPELNGQADKDSLLGRFSRFIGGMRKGNYIVPPEQLTIDAINDRLKVHPVEKSNVFNIQFRSEDPMLAKAVTNKIANTYLSRQRDGNLQRNEENIKRLKTVVADLEKKLAIAVREEKDFRKKTGTQKTPGQNGGTLLQAQISQLNQELGLLKRQESDSLVRAQNIRDVLKSGGDIFSVSDIVRNRYINRLSEQVANIELQISQLGQRYGAGHPTMKGLHQQLARANVQLTRAAGKVAAGLENEAKIAKARGVELQKKLDGLITRDSGASHSHAELSRLEVKVISLKKLLATYESRLRDLIARSSGQMTDVIADVVSYAHVATSPYFPKLLPMSLLAFVISLLLGLAYVILKALMATSSAGVDYWRTISHELEGHLLETRKDKIKNIEDKRSAG